MTQVFTLAHLSDPHLPMPHAPWRELLNKRFTGYVNWWRNRVQLHVPQALAAIVADIGQQRPDHIALTGDLVNVSLPGEYRLAADWLAGLAVPERLTVIPGNHDVYVPLPWRESVGLWAPWMAGDGVPPPENAEQAFPFVRRRGNVALVGLSTGVPTLPLFATGTLGGAQIDRAGRLLEELGREGFYRVVLIHHPPLATEKRVKWLTDTADFQAMIRRAGCELILHGHNHRTEVGRVEGPAGPVPVLGVASASAAPVSKYGAARYHVIRIARAGRGWTARVEIRRVKDDCSGCAADGTMTFHTGAAMDMVA